jgi:hypothetical protein
MKKAIISVFLPSKTSPPLVFPDTGIRFARNMSVFVARTNDLLLYGITKALALFGVWFVYML